MIRCEACLQPATYCCGGLDVPMLHFCEQHGKQHEAAHCCGGALVRMGEPPALVAVLAVPPQEPEKPMEPLNHDGESLHTGDDDRIDYVASIRTGIEEIIADADEYDKAEILELIRELLDDCDQLDQLLIATIQQERVAAVPPQEAPPRRGEQEELAARVGPSVPCVAPAGSSAEPSPGAVTAAERTE